MPFPVQAPARNQVSDIGVIVDEDGTGNAVILSSEGDNLPALANNEIFCITGTTGGGATEHPNHGIYIVRDPSPTTSQVKAVRLGDSQPVTDTNMPNAAISKGGRLYQHVGDRTIPQAAANGNQEVISMKLGVQKDLDEAPPPPPE